MAVTEDRRERYAVAWLFLLHSMIVAAVCAVRMQEADWGWADVVSAAVCRSQFCLLCAWLAAGTDNLSWRFCGLLGGSCFIFTVFARTAFPDGLDVGFGMSWQPADWTWFFRYSQPGDLLLKAPVYLVGVCCPIAAWRLVVLLRSQDKQSREPIGRRVAASLRFNMGDAIVWIVTISLVMIAVFQTAPYEEWYRELWSHCRQSLTWENQSVFVASALQICLVLGAVGSVTGSRYRWLRILAAGLGAAGVTAFIYHDIDPPSRRWETAGWTNACISAILIWVSVLLVHACRQIELPTRRRP
ncbi:MAG: hypothetical protein QGG36_32375 [Pirellulaceae bacterium]|jgi:hypothetical protein|nr:hypothetical protein [Pirellulaceae bacterium]MDP7020541.1 hypothetical protein [Pirellulaceae bacterium]